MRDQIGSAHPRHDDVRHDQVDRTRMLPCEPQRLLGVRPLQDGVALPGQDVSRQPPHGGLVLDEQHRLTPTNDELARWRADPFRF